MKSPGAATLRPVQIRVLTQSEYEVVLRSIDDEAIIRCEVSESGGIRTVIPRPDFFTNRAANPRQVAAAVIAFHLAATGMQDD